MRAAAEVGWQKKRGIVLFVQGWEASKKKVFKITEMQNEET